jgi:hypothetical protein
MQITIKQPLSNVQLELLKAFSHQLPENDLLELRKLIAHFFAQKLIQQADKVWEEKNWTEQTVEDLLNTKMRKAK